MTTPNLIDQVKEALEGATPGPWEEHDGQIWSTWPDMDDGWRFRHCLADIRKRTGAPRYEEFEGCDGNGRLMALSHAMARHIIAQEERLRAVEAALTRIRGWRENDWPDHQPMAASVIQFIEETADEVLAALAAFHATEAGE